MKLIICTNFALPFHMGGSERVCQQIAETFVNEFNYEVTILCQYGNGEVIHNGVSVRSCGDASDHDFLSLLKGSDIILVYSDNFFRLSTILENVDSIDGKKIICPVGLNRIRSNLPQFKHLSNLFFNNIEKIKVFTHSDKYDDSLYLKQKGVNFSIVPNAIDLQEFSKSDFNFKEHYNIKSDKILLCVSNFFHGKGHNFLLPVIKCLSRRTDFTVLFISSTLSIPLFNAYRSSIQENALRMGLPIKFIKDIPREHVIQSFFNSSAFVFGSSSECSPLCILESMAAGLPWVSFAVGNVPDLAGGICIDNSYSKIEAGNVKLYSTKVENLLDSVDFRTSLGSQGLEYIKKYHDWEKVKNQYKALFEQ